MNTHLFLFLNDPYEIDAPSMKETELKSKPLVLTRQISDQNKRDL